MGEDADNQAFDPERAVATYRQVIASTRIRHDRRSQGRVSRHRRAPYEMAFGEPD
jgi:hypothetical protein